MRVASTPFSATPAASAVQASATAASYAKENFEVTLGNFYEQFGSGSLRAYEERQLGVDNALDGFGSFSAPATGDPQGRRQATPRRLRPDRGQHPHHGREINLNDAFERSPPPAPGSPRGQFRQPIPTGQHHLQGHMLKLLDPGVPRQIQKGLQLLGEYVRKSMTPTPTTAYLRRRGILVNAGWSAKDWASTSASRGSTTYGCSDRNLQLFDVPVNYPAIPVAHYNLAATLYPYATVVRASGLIRRSSTPSRKSKLGGSTAPRSASIRLAAASTPPSGVEGAVDGYDRNSWRPAPAASATSTSTSAGNSRRTSRPSTPAAPTSTPLPPRSPPTSRAS